jgi:methylenetetrahydrofolate dehydrogenase (NADP+)/methenyltetrahydrofolate cyclohydrolase
MIVDGRALAKEVCARTKARAEKLPHRPKVIAYVAHDPTPAMRSYLNIKKRMAETAGCVFEETKDPTFFRDADAVIVQLPTTPEATVALNAIKVEQDADVLSKTARKKFENGDRDALLPPVIAAISEIFRAYGVEPKGKHAVVIGAGFLVGQPAAVWLRKKLATVSTVTDPTNLERYLKDADIIISGAGSPHIIKPEMLKQGAVLVDAGTSESSGVIVGDADPACATKCSVFTPVPGGVGPLAVACLFENAVTLAERAGGDLTE